MSDLMFYGVLRMPYIMAMSDEISRLQFYSRVQECADRCETAEALVAAQARTIEEKEALLNQALKDVSDLYDRQRQDGNDIAQLKAAQAQPPVIAMQINRINLPHGAHFTRETKTTGENGWVLRNVHGIIRALNAYEAEIIDCTIAAHRQQQGAEQVAAHQHAKPLPRWIDEAKGRDPFTDDLIAYIEGIHPSQRHAQAAQPYADNSQQHEEPTGPNHPGHHDGRTCEAVSQVLADLGSQRAPAQPIAGKLPPPPIHPEPHSHKWTEMEQRVICTYGHQCRAVGREDAAKVCDDYSDNKWALYKGHAPYLGNEEGRADPMIQGESNGAEECANYIRALNKGGA